MLAPNGREMVQTFGDDFAAFRPWWPGKTGGMYRTTYKDGWYAKSHPLHYRCLPTNGERQLYVDPSLPGAPNPFVPKNGVLHITADRMTEALKAALEPLQRDEHVDLSGDRYTSGVITTQPCFNQLYGYFEARLKTPVGKGLWSAFWLQPTDLTHPPEIDVMENIGDPLKTHWASHSSRRNQWSIGGDVALPPPDPEAKGFRTYSVSWDPREIIWYVDRQEIARIPTPDDAHKPMYMILNLAVGGPLDWVGVPDASTKFPAALEVHDWKAFQFPNLVPQ